MFLSSIQTPLLAKPVSTRSVCSRRLTVAPKAITKPELIAAVQRRVPEATKTSVTAIVQAFLDTVVTSVTEGEPVNIIGFGKFEQRQRKARTGRDPRTSEPIDIPASKSPAFSAGKTFKDIVQGKQSPPPAASADGVNSAEKPTATKAATKATTAPKAKAKSTPAASTAADKPKRTRKAAVKPTKGFFQ